MSIIMVDCEDCYKRADRLLAASQKLEEYAGRLDDSCQELKAGLLKQAEVFHKLKDDIYASTDIWTDFYKKNVRL